jgi:peptide/nickel transport system permease protein
VAQAPPRARCPGFWRRALRHRSFVIGAVLTLLLLLAAALSLVWTPWSPYEMDMPTSCSRRRLALAGHRPYGRDVVSLLLVGARASILVGVIAVGIGLLVGTALGLLAAARRGWVEEVIMRSPTSRLAFPAILSAIMMTAVFGPGIVNAIIAIGIYNIPTFARITRASANAVWSREFVLAARACGKGGFASRSQHVLPNISAVLIVQITIRFAIAILAEAALSYLGLGTQPPQPSWGRMLSEAQTMMFQAPLLAVFPGHGHRAGRAGPEPAGRRPARPARPPRLAR